MKPANALLILLMTLLCGLSACSREATDAGDAAAPGDTALDRSHDHFTLANYEAFTTRHLALDLDVDFEARTLSGLATLHMQALDKEAREIILDTRSLHIQGVWMGNGDDRQPAEFACMDGKARREDMDPVPGRQIDGGYAEFIKLPVRIQRQGMRRNGPSLAKTGKDTFG